MPEMSAASLPRSAAVYIRVSTEDQAELSPDSQLEEIEKYAVRENMTILREHIYIDAGISGKRAERRPAFLAMIAAAKEKDCPFSAILVWKFSRFARNQEESIFYKSVLRSKCGIEVLSITEPLAAGPFGSLMERIIEWMDEFYSIRLSQEVKRSMAVNAQRGKLQCAAAFGYRAEGGRLVPEEREEGWVRYIFDSFLAGKGFFSIARELNRLGVRTHRGNRFESRTVEYILGNPVYTGKLRWNPDGRARRSGGENLIIADAEHQPLVSPEAWEAVQCRLKEEKALHRGKARPAEEGKRLLSGIVRWAACGGTLVFAKPHYYKCGSYTRGRCGYSQHIRCDLLEEAVLARLAADIQTTGQLDYEITEKPHSGGGLAPALESALRQVKLKQSRLLDAYLAKAMDLEEFAAAKRELEQYEADIQQDLEGFRAEANVDSASLLAEIEAALEQNAVPALQNSALRAIIERCVFDKEAAVLSIVYRADLQALS